MPYETDEITRLIIDSHDATAFAPDRALDRGRLPRLAAGHDAEDSAARSPRVAPGRHPGDGRGGHKIMRNQDLILVGRRRRG